MLRWKLSTILIPALVIMAPSVAGTLRIGTPTVEEQRVAFPVYLEGDVGDGVSALDFRLTYDAAVFKPVAVAAGPAATDADKRVEWNVRTPGECIVVMMGMNQTACRSGEVSRVVFQRTESARNGAYEFAVTSPTLSSLDGQPIAVEGTAESFRLGDGPEKPVTPEDDRDPTPNSGDASSTDKPSADANSHAEDEARVVRVLPGDAFGDGFSEAETVKAAGVQAGRDGPGVETADGSGIRAIDRDVLARSDRVRGMAPGLGPRAQAESSSISAKANEEPVVDGGDSASGTALRLADAAPVRDSSEMVDPSERAGAVSTAAPRGVASEPSKRIGRYHVVGAVVVALGLMLVAFVVRGRMIS